MSAWLVVVLAGGLTYLLRISMLVVAARFRVPGIIQQAAPSAVPVAFGALAATSLAGLAAEEGAEALSAIAAVAFGALVAHKTRSARAAIYAGLPAVWVLSAIAG